MATKVIKLNNGTDTYVPVTVASAVQYSYTTGYMSVQEAIGTLAQASLPISDHINTKNIDFAYNAGNVTLTGVHTKDSNNVSIKGEGLTYIKSSGTNSIIIGTTATANTGTVTSITPGDGLLNGTTTNAINTSGTLKVALKDYTKNAADATTADTSGGTLEPVQLDKSGKLAVYVKDTDTHNSHVITWSGSDFTPTSDTVSVISYYKAQTNTLNPNGTVSYIRATVPTKKYVDDQIGSAIHLKGTIGPSNADVTTLPTQNVKEGDAYLVKLDSGTNTTILSGQTLENGDLIIATSTTPTWTVIQNNLSIATSSKAGTVKPGTTNGKNYGVSVATDGAMTVNVPWTDNDHTSSVKLSGSKGSNNVVSNIILSSSTSGSNTEYTLAITYSSIISNVTSKLQGENVSTGGAYIQNIEGSASNSKIWLKPGDNVSISYTGTSPNQYIEISATDTKYSSGTGISISGTTINHSNSVTAQTTAALKKFKYDAQGHITGVANVSTSSVGINSLKYKVGNTVDDIDDAALGLTFGDDLNVASLTGTTTFVTA